MNPKVWEASGHLKGFSDPLMDCRQCKTRHRADQLIENWSKGKVSCEGWSNDQMDAVHQGQQYSVPGLRRP
jgi:glycyl-tRNA synthetase